MYMYHLILNAFFKMPTIQLHVKSTREKDKIYVNIMKPTWVVPNVRRQSQPYIFNEN